MISYHRLWLFCRAGFCLYLSYAVSRVQQEKLQIPASGFGGRAWFRYECDNSLKKRCRRDDVYRRVSNRGDGGGVLIGYWMHLNRKTSYLISSGTAICGGSAIAAVGPVLKADDHEMAVSLGVIFILNAIALFIFPPIGHYFEMSQAQFGTWAAIAIHDTSSVVGAGMPTGVRRVKSPRLSNAPGRCGLYPLLLPQCLCSATNQAAR